MAEQLWKLRSWLSTQRYRHYSAGTLLWNWLRRQFAPCLHRKLMLPRRDEMGDYQRCLNCGARLPWAVEIGSWRPEELEISAIDREALERVAVDDLMIRLEEEYEPK